MLSLGYGMPCPTLFGLLDDLGRLIQGQTHIIAQANDDRQTGWVEGVGGAQYMLEHRAAGDGMEHLGQARAHPRPLAGRQNGDGQSHGRMWQGYFRSRC